MVKDITEKDFTGLKDRKATAILDLHAEWCGPCKAQSPIIDRLADKFKDVEFYKIDVDEYPNIAAALGVRGIPTIVTVKDGEIKDFLVGMQSEAKLTEILKGL